MPVRSRDRFHAVNGGHGVHHDQGGNKMHIIPDLNIGIFNAWLGVIPILLSMVIIFVPNRNALKRGADMSSYTGKEKFIALTSTAIFYSILIYTVFVPLKLGTAWFYTGVIIYLAGIVPYIAGMVEFSRTPGNEPAVKGVYKISRNPMYFFSFIILLGMGVAGASWPILSLASAYLMLNHRIILSEERFCAEKYGAPYDAYTRQVPRYFLFF